MTRAILLEAGRLFEAEATALRSAWQPLPAAAHVEVARLYSVACEIYKRADAMQEAS